MVLISPELRREVTDSGQTVPLVILPISDGYIATGMALTGGKNSPVVDLGLYFP